MISRILLVKTIFSPGSKKVDDSEDDDEWNVSSRMKMKHTLALVSILWMLSFPYKLVQA